MNAQRVAEVTSVEQQWRARPGGARAVGALAVALPIAASLATTASVARMVPTPSSWATAAPLAIALLLLGTLVALIAERRARRLASLATLLRMELTFPGPAPTRRAVAFGARGRAQADALEELRAASTPEEASRWIVSLAGHLRSHDALTAGHSERVREYTELIARELGLGADDRNKLRWAALLHDVGKLTIDGDILNKPGRLTDDEYEIVKTHPEAGMALVEPMQEWLGEWARGIAEHHEKFDGSGYPRGLAGTEIHLGARIVAVADVFDVITSVRSYKEATSVRAARAELVRCVGTHFDPQVVDAFLRVSVSRLRWFVGPVAWLAQLPVLASVRPQVLGPARISVASPAGLDAAPAVLGLSTVRVAGAGAIGLSALAAPVAVAEAPALFPLPVATAVADVSDDVIGDDDPSAIVLDTSTRGGSVVVDRSLSASTEDDPEARHGDEADESRGSEAERKDVEQAEKDAQKAAKHDEKVAKQDAEDAEDGEQAEKEVDEAEDKTQKDAEKAAKHDAKDAEQAENGAGQAEDQAAKHAEKAAAQEAEGPAEGDAGKAAKQEAKDTEKADERAAENAGKTAKGA